MGHARVVLKLSGDALSGKGGCIDRGSLQYISAELSAAAESDTQIAVVVGAGNIMRGANFGGKGRGRLLADHCGMLGTIINALMLQESLVRRRMSCNVLSSLKVEGIVEAFTAQRCEEALQAGQTVLLAGGTGNPFFTTDTAAALRAVEIGADAVLKATRVDGVYSSDPEKEASATLYRELTFEQVLDQRLGVMDLTAASLCLQHGIPVRVFNFRTEGNLLRAIQGESVGTLIRSEKHAD